VADRPALVGSHMRPAGIGAGDPLATGLVASLSRPEGNTTGVTDLFPSIAGKWLELLKQCVPGLTRVAVVGNPDRLISERIDNYAAIAAQTGAPHRVEVVKLPVRNISEIESAVTAFAGKPDGGLIVLPPPFSNAERETINIRWAKKPSALALGLPWPLGDLVNRTVHLSPFSIRPT
jgi:putative tryptophan/tyrosine transport system substrate-binding protein